MLIDDDLDLVGPLLFSSKFIDFAAQILIKLAASQLKHEIR